MVLRRRRLRAVTYEELPWRTQVSFNRIGRDDRLVNCTSHPTALSTNVSNLLMWSLIFVTESSEDERAASHFGSEPLENLIRETPSWAMSLWGRIASFFLPFFAPSFATGCRLLLGGHIVVIQGREGAGPKGRASFDERWQCVGWRPSYTESVAFKGTNPFRKIIILS